MALAQQGRRVSLAQVDKSAEDPVSAWATVTIEETCPKTRATEAWRKYG